MKILTDLKSEWSSNRPAVILFVLLVLALIFAAMFFMAFSRDEDQLSLYGLNTPSAERDFLEANNNLECPSAYATPEERGKALVIFNDSLEWMNPSQSLDQLIEARIDFYIQHGCADELEKYGYDGTSTIDAAEITLRQPSNLLQMCAKRSLLSIAIAGNTGRR